MATGSSSRKRKFSNVCTVALVVGSDKARFDVHEDRLCEVSTFFKAALTSDFRESLERTVQLPEDNVDTVDMFVEWLYEQRCDMFSDKPWDSSDPRMMQAFQLLVFGEKYDIPSLESYVLGKILCLTEGDIMLCFKQDVMEYVYKNTCPGSGIRRLVADWSATYDDRQWYQREDAQQWLLSNPEIAVDLLVAFSQIPDAGHVPEPLKRYDIEHYKKPTCVLSSVSTIRDPGPNVDRSGS